VENKVLSYMGFAARARKLVTGYNTCIYMMEKKKIKLLIITEDLAENSAKKMVSAAERYSVPCKIYGTKEQLSRRTGNVDKGIYGILDDNFAKVIAEAMDNM
jgi:ribosomal protein L7Ae-like RNA K-turn-binding protein